MKRLLLILLLLPGCLSAAITVGNNTTNSLSSVTSIAVAFPSNVTVGSGLFAGVRGSSAPRSPVTFSDNKGNSWTTLFTQDTSTVFAVGYALNAAAGATTVTATITGAAVNMRLNIFEVKGILTSGAKDQEANAGPTPSSSPSTGATGARVQASEVLLGFMRLGTGSTISAGSGFTLLDDNGGVLGTEYQIVSSGGTDAITFSLAASQTWVVYGVTIKGLGGGASVILSSRRRR